MDPWLQLLAATPIVLLVASFATPLISARVRSPRFYSSYLTALALLTVVTTWGVAIDYATRMKPLVYPFGGWPPPLGISFEVDGLNAFVGPIVSLVFLAAAVFCFWYFERMGKGCEWLTALAMLMMAGSLGCIYTGDVFNFFVMLEVACISSYAMVAFFRKRRWAIEAAASYAFVGALATTLFLLGAVYIYASFGTLNMADIAAKSLGLHLSAFTRLSGSCSSGMCFGNAAVGIAVAVALMLWALTFEAGIFPNNFWVPSAYSEAPSPASAMFAGIVDKVGTYGVLRIVLTLLPIGASTIAVRIWGAPYRDVVLEVLAFLGIVTGYLGAFLMAVQNDVKRLLAYSTISHIGIMFSTLAAATIPSVAALATASIVFHMATHAFGEAMLFIALGAIATVVGSRRLSDMAGLGRRHPGIAVLVAIALLSLLGMPPLGGFFSKYMMFLALVEAGYIPYAVSIVIISGISAVGYFRIMYSLFMPRASGSSESPSAGSGSVGRSTYVATSILAAAIIALGIAFVCGYLATPLVKYVGIAATHKGVELYARTAAEVAAKLLPR
ncbi:MAG: hypothetical protein GXO32_00315 [Crenarchaeota archaeon]|nr:hypothetical protein [Thermoproteota archaeon]